MSNPDDREELMPMMFPSEMARRRTADDPARPADEREPQVEGREAQTGSAARRDAATLGLRLLLENKDRPAAVAQGFAVTHQPLTIGRSASCELRLEDEARVVSGQHARITPQGDRFELRDLRSKNLTYLNGAALEPDRPYGIGPGDVIEIGGFSIRVLPAEEEPAADEAADTVLAADFVNPFDEEARELVGVLARIAEQYACEPPGRRDAALRQAFDEALGSQTGGEAADAVRRMLGRLSAGH